MFRLPKFNQYWLEILLIFIAGLIPLLWFKQGYLAAGHDMSYPLAPIDFWLDRLFVWTDRMGGFSSNQTDAIPGIFNHGWQALFYLISGSFVHGGMEALQLAQKLDFVFWFTLPGITMYILLHSLHPNKDDFLLRISGSLFCMLNHYLLQGWIIAEMSKFSIVSALPLIVLAIINVNLKNGSVLKNAMFVAITLFFLNGGAGIPLWGGMFICAITTLVISLVVSPVALFKKVRKVITFSALSLVFVLLLNLYWIYPYVASYAYNYTLKLGKAGGAEGAVAWSQAISSNASFTNIIKLQGVPDWYDNPNHPYSGVFINNYLFMLLAIVFPALAFIRLTGKKGEEKDNLRYKVIFIALLVVGIPFTAG